MLGGFEEYLVSKAALNEKYIPYLRGVESGFYYLKLKISLLRSHLISLF
jgi:hypothetical protein